MQIEVVYHTSEGKNVVVFEKCGVITVHSDNNTLSIENEDGDVVGEFLVWTYWRKTGD
jgi:hypothetical protein